MGKAAFFDNPRGSLEDATRSALGSGLPASLVAGAVDALFSSATPQTIARTSHAFTLHAVVAGRSSVVGAVFGVAENQSRTIEDEFEIDAFGTGLPVDMVPQNLGSRTLTIDRYDLFTRLIEEVFQTSPEELVTLAHQIRGFSLREVWRDPGSVLASTTRAYNYSNCWFQSRGRKIRADDNRIVTANATLVWGNKVRVI